MVLEDARYKVTRQQILESWPPDFLKPTKITLWRWLDHAVKANLLACDGTGRKTQPFRYWLPAREAVWNKDPIYQVMEQQERERKELFQ